MSRAWHESYVMQPKRRAYRSHMARLQGPCHVDHRELARLGAERDPEDATRGVEGEMARPPAEAQPSEHASAKHVDDCDILSPRIRHVRVTPLGRRCGVARLPEAAEHVADIDATEDAELTDGGVRDDRVLANALDAAWIRTRLDPAQHRAARDIERNDG